MNLKVEQKQEQERVYKPSEVAQKLNITTDLLRKWSDEFNVPVETTDGGHRRYSISNVELLISISKRIKEQNWSWDQVKAWRNGEVEMFTSHEERSNLEKKLDDLMDIAKNQEEKLERQEQFNQALIQKLNNMEKYIADQLPNRVDIENRDKQLLEKLNNNQEKKRNKSLLNRFFSR